MFLAILSALSALVGPAVELLKTFYQFIEGWHQTSDTTPDELATEAVALFKDASAFTSDVQTQIAMVSQALKERHSNLDTAHATVTAAMASKASG